MSRKKQIEGKGKTISTDSDVFAIFKKQHFCTDIHYSWDIKLLPVVVHFWSSIFNTELNDMQFTELNNVPFFFLEKVSWKKL